MSKDYGIKISLPGIGITDTDFRNYSFWSKYPIMKTYLFGTYNYTFASDLSTVDINITHNLGYLAAVWFSIDGTHQNSEWKTWDWWAFWFDDGHGNQALRSWRIQSDTNQIILSYRETIQHGSGVNTNAEQWTFKYYVFIEPIL